MNYIPSPDSGIHIEDHIFYISADLGQANDYTAISILERITKGYGVLGYKERGEIAYHLRHIERPPRGTEYPAIADRIMQIAISDTMKDHEKAIVLDYTGVGRPVYDMMIEKGFEYCLTGISITGGNDANYNKGVYNVPKRDLITNLQVMLQEGSLKIAKGIKEGDALVDEMMNFQVKISATGHDTYGARSGTHDDIVLSVAMACWLAKKSWCRSSL